MLDADANASRAVFSMSHVSVVVERVVQLLLHQRALSSLNIGALSLFWPDITLLVAPSTVLQWPNVTEFP